MDYLREGIHLRGFAQIDPLVAYKNEGFTMFHELMNSIWEEYARLIFHVQVEVSPAQGEQLFGPAEGPRQVEYQGGGQEQPSALNQAGAATAQGTATATGAIAAGGVPTDGDGAAAEEQAALPQQPTTHVKDEHDKIGRNDPCWCGSGKKYKKCHGA